MVSKPQRRQRVEYKKPGKINAVSISLAMFLGLLVYLGYCLWPSVHLSSEVSTLVRTELLAWYNTNLVASTDRNVRKKKILDGLKLAIRKKGVTDPNLELEAYGDKKVVWIEARFVTPVEWLWLDKTWVWKHTNRVETSAERVDW